jgi:hypothetical protein
MRGVAVRDSFKYFAAIWSIFLNAAERIRVEFVSFVEGSDFDSGPTPR